MVSTWRNEITGVFKAIVGLCVGDVEETEPGYVFRLDYFFGHFPP